jgi:hypothetical protein
MIARHEAHMDRTDVWSKLAAALPAGVISWRQDGKPVPRDGRHFARFVAYIDANTVRERLDSVVPGEWDLTLELLPPIPGSDDEPATASFKARLQILGVIREDVGTGKDYKSAATDAFKRAAVRFGVAHELYDYEQNWVQVDGDSRYARPLEDPQSAYTRRWGTPGAPARGETGASSFDVGIDPVEPFDASAPGESRPTRMLTMSAPDVAEQPACPKCGGRTWDNRATKRNPKAPDFKCRDRSCDGVIWPAKAAPKAPRPVNEELSLDSAPLATGTDDIPF